MNICDAKEIPYISTYMDEDAALKSAVLNMHPQSEPLTRLMMDFMNASDWKQATILYESTHWLRRIAKIFETNNPNTNRMNARYLEYKINDGFRPTLLDVRDADETNIILECSTESLPTILRQAMEVGLMTKHFRWIIANLDTHSIDLKAYSYSGANITVFSLLNSNHEIFDSQPEIEDTDSSDVFYVEPDSRWNVDNRMENEKCSSNYNRNIMPTYPEKLNGM